MKRGSVFLILLLFSICGYSTKYRLNEQKIDKLFNSSLDVTNEVFGSFEQLTGNQCYNLSSLEEDEDLSEKELLAGFIALGGLFATGGFIGGIIPLHRYVIGTGGNSAMIQLSYCFTYGMCGLLPLIDGILLIIDSSEDGTKYIEKRKILLWME